MNHLKSNKLTLYHLCHLWSRIFMWTCSSSMLTCWRQPLTSTWPQAQLNWISCQSWRPHRLSERPKLHEESLNCLLNNTFIHSCFSAEHKPQFGEEIWPLHWVGVGKLRDALIIWVDLTIWHDNFPPQTASAVFPSIRAHDLFSSHMHGSGQICAWRQSWERNPPPPAHSPLSVCYYYSCSVPWLLAARLA